VSEHAATERKGCADAALNMYTGALEGLKARTGKLNQPKKPQLDVYLHDRDVARDTCTRTTHAEASRQGAAGAILPELWVSNHRQVY
jgi:hypothetical protein